MFNPNTLLHVGVSLTARNKVCFFFLRLFWKPFLKIDDIVLGQAAPDDFSVWTFADFALLQEMVLKFD